MTQSRGNDVNVAILKVDPKDKEKNPGLRLRILGTLTTPSARIGALVVTEDLMIERLAGQSSAVLRVDALTVSRGATLTLGKAGSPVDLRVPLKKSLKDDDPVGILTVNGMIDGPGTVWIAHDDNDDSSGRGAAGDDYFHMSSDYAPDKDNLIGAGDCVRITGSGEIENEIRAIAAGNICIELGKIGDLTVAGSIDEPDGGATSDKDITTDIIFRNEVEVDGDVIQWNDARVVFEKNATITGGVKLRDGTLPIDKFPEWDRG